MSEPRGDSLACEESGSSPCAGAPGACHELSQCALQALACRTFVGQASAVAAIRLDERLPEDAPDPFTR